MTKAQEELDRRLAVQDHTAAVALRQRCEVLVAAAQRTLRKAIEDETKAAEKLAGLPGTGVAEAPENAPSREDGAASVPDPAHICAVDDEC